MWVMGLELPFSLSTAGDVVSGQDRRRDAIPRRRRALGFLFFTEPSGVFRILKAFLKSLQNEQKKTTLDDLSRGKKFRRDIMMIENKTQRKHKHEIEYPASRAFPYITFKTENKILGAQIKLTHFYSLPSKT